MERKEEEKRMSGIHWWGRERRAHRGDDMIDPTKDNRGEERRGRPTWEMKGKGERRQHIYSDSQVNVQALHIKDYITHILLHAYLYMCT